MLVQMLGKLSNLCMVLTECSKPLLFGDYSVPLLLRRLLLSTTMQFENECWRMSTWDFQEFYLSHSKK